MLIAELCSAITASEWDTARESLDRLYGTIEDSGDPERRDEIQSIIDSLESDLDVLKAAGLFQIYSSVQPLILAPDAFVEVDRRLAEAIIAKPEVLDSVDSRSFEELIASIYSKLGFDVLLTKRTCDGGRPTRRT